MQGDALKTRVNLFYIVTALFWASLYTYQPTLSPYLKSIGVGYAMIGVIGGSYGFTQMVLRIPLGILSDRLGKRKVFIIGGLAIGTISSLILFMADNAFTVLLGRSLAGVAASVWVVFTVLFASYFEREKSASRMSFLSMVNNAGQVAAMLLGGLFAIYVWDSRWFPFLMGAVVGAAGLALSFFIRENVPVRIKPPTLRALLSVAKDKNLMVMSVLAILAQIVLFGTTITFTPVVATSLQATGEQLGYLSMLGNVPRILSAFVCGILLARKTNIKRLLAASFVMLAAGSLLTPFCPNLWSLYAVSALSGFGSGLSMTTLISLCTRGIEEERRSAGMGYFQAIYGVGMFIGPVAIGIFADGLGLSWGFVFSAVVAAAGVWGSLRFVEE